MYQTHKSSRSTKCDLRLL